MTDLSWIDLIPKDSQKLLLGEIDLQLARRRLAGYEPYPKQIAFHNAGSTHRERLLMAGNQLGKFGRVDEPVLTPSGWVRIGDIRIGDRVISGDGSITKVIGVYPQGVQPLIEITFCYGQKVIVGHEHLWKVLEPKNRFRTRCKSLKRNGKGPRPTTQVPNERFDQWSVMTTAAIRARCGDDPAPLQRFATPAVGVVQMDAQPVEIDPYVLGILLGDGGLTQGISLASADAEIVAAVAEEVRRYGGELHYHSRYDYRVRQGAKLKQALALMGVMGKGAADKRVPQCYLWNTPDVRLAVLQGLMDSDGTCEKSGITSFTSISAQLAEDVMFLARSFGAKCRIRSRVTSYTHRGEVKQGQRSYTVTIRMPAAPLFRLARKLERYIRPVSTTDHNLMVSFRDIEPGEAVCIAVDHPDHTYVTTDFIVTHNTWSAAAETSMHLTGRYPDWWQGRNFRHPVQWCAASETGLLTRDGVQRVLFGTPAGPLGTGMVPADAIIEVIRNTHGVAELYEMARVRHGGGGDVQAGESLLYLRSYDQGRARIQAMTLNGFWFDEEPPEDYYIEGLTRTNTTLGPVYLTFTPLKGMSAVVKRFLMDRIPGTHVTQMGIRDALHYSPEQIETIVASYPPHQREARTNGTPIMGSGLIYPVPRAQLEYTPFAIPSHWRRIAGIDFGWTHPTAGAWIAHDPDSDVIYVYDAYRVAEQPVLVHAAAFKARGEWIPVARPGDGDNATAAGPQLAQQYRAAGVNMRGERAQFPEISDNSKENTQPSRVSVEAGIADIYDRMLTGRFKVASHLEDWWQEFGLYHREDGKVVKLVDDLLDATRYAVMDLRFATTPPVESRLRLNQSFNWRAG